jgi:hypothetical protein
MFGRKLEGKKYKTLRKQKPKNYSLFYFDFETGSCYISQAGLDPNFNPTLQR